jgi:ligand-binding sensor domain-containing protein
MRRRSASTRSPAIPAPTHSRYNRKDLWIVTSNGIDMLRQKAVVTFSTHEGLSADLVQSVLATRDGTVWVGNAEALDYLRGRQHLRSAARMGYPDMVTALYEDHAGRLWVGVDGLLMVYNRKSFRTIVRPDGRPALWLRLPKMRTTTYGRRSPTTKLPCFEFRIFAFDRCSFGASADSGVSA